jgi:1,2-diacylglycerol 3-beta-glucosyltransferase
LPEELALDLIDFDAGMDGRRLKAALIMGGVWSTIVGLHLLPGGFWVIWVLAIALTAQTIRLLMAKPSATPTDIAAFPCVSLLVSAHNEEAVVQQLVTNLCQLDYPEDRYEVWVIDDRSTDRTPQILDELATKYHQLRVLHRTAGTGGKSGALNQVMPLVKGELIGVFDADAQVSANFLHELVPYFDQPRVGAVQMRKSIANADLNWLTQGQSMEQILDAYIQQQRIASGGIGELRGNGQFVRRRALEECDGWNEETITDDLDLTLRLHLSGWDINLALWPNVREEGVTTLAALWPQRQRWAEGGYQRYLDYWRLLADLRLGGWKTWDLVTFALMQYVLPPATIPDFAMSISLHQAPLLAPLTAIGIFLQLVGMAVGLQRLGLQPTIGNLGRGLIYMTHWVIVMPWAMVRMAIWPKTLRWVKTPRQADLPASGNFP